MRDVWKSFYQVPIGEDSTVALVAASYDHLVADTRPTVVHFLIQVQIPVRVRVQVQVPVPAQAPIDTDMHYRCLVQEDLVTEHRVDS